MKRIKMKNFDCYKKSGPSDYNIVYSEYKPISAWGYAGLNVLYAIPVIGWLVFICHILSPNASSHRSYARSFLCMFLISLILGVILAVAGYAFIIVGFGSFETFQEILAQYAATPAA